MEIYLSKNLGDEVDELPNVSGIDQILQEEVDRECKFIREGLHDARFVGTCSGIRC